MFCEVFFNKIDQLYREYVSIWEDVCNIESPTNYKKGVDEVGNYFIKLAEKFGWKVEVLKQNISGNAICITMNENSKGHPIALSGHMDTVQPLGLFGSPAVKMDEEYIYGPGVLDCKGGIVSGFLAMHTLKECGYIDRPIKMLLQSDEETSSCESNKATINFICEKAKDCVAFFNLEPNAKGCVCIERKGILKYCFNIIGVEAHAGLCAVEGSNAILEASNKIIEIEKIKNNEGVTCNVGVIKGGSVVNTVAGECTFEVDVRFANKKQQLWAEEQMEKIANTQFVKGCKTTLNKLSYRVAMELCDKNRVLLDKINDILSKNGFDVLAPIKGAGGSDGADVTAFGIPCIDSIGVNGFGLHTPNEKALLTSLKDSAKRLCAIFSSF